MKDKRQFLLQCYELGIIKFGKFTLKSGIKSPFYIDLRPLASDPLILRQLSIFLLELVSDKNFEIICGVPYAALPMATAMSLESGIPLIIKRKEAKDYGTKKLIEGIFQAGQNCLLVEDVITSGKSLEETIEEIEREKISVKNIVVVLDREQGGTQLLQQRGYSVSALFTISEVCRILLEENKITSNQFQQIEDFITGNEVKFDKKSRKSYQDKLTVTVHEKAKKLLEIAVAKQSNLIASADVTTTAELLDFAEKTGPHIVALKTHIDIISDFDYQHTVVPLQKLAQQYQFLLMEDRKFADIGNTQQLQYNLGKFQISTWADLVTSHVIGGAESLNCFDKAGVIAILSMSSKGTLTDKNYFDEAQKIASHHKNVIGGVSQFSLTEDLLHFTPGVNLEISGDGKGQQYQTPQYVFQNLMTDFIIVGRGIYQAEDVQEAAQLYQNEGWTAYVESLE